MQQYLRMLSDVLENGEFKRNRTGIQTITSTPKFFEHDMRTGFPLLTTKRMSLKTIAIELEFFIKGLTDKRWLQERKCHIWDKWSNPCSLPQKQDDWTHKPDEAEHIKQLQFESPDLGPIYGYQWRRFNRPYVFDKNSLEETFIKRCEDDGWEGPDGFDQLSAVLDTLKTDPDSRRMVVSAWNPNQQKQMALPPCHLLFIFQHLKGKLSLSWTQRSADAFLGVPYNIASYGLLLELVANEVGMTPHMLTGTFVDFHIYSNHVKQCQKQLERTFKKLPTLRLPESLRVFDWTHDQFALDNYKPHPAIKAPVAV